MNKEIDAEKDLSTLTESTVASSLLLRAKIFPDSDDSGNSPGDGPDGVRDRIEHTYNIQGEVATTEDQNGTTHVYYRDPLGRILRHRARDR